MTIDGLDHWTIKASDLERTLVFYERVIGLRRGYRPDLPGFPQGAWLYCNDRPIVHLLPGGASQLAGSGCIDHIALRGRGLRDFLATLDELRLPYREVRASTNVPRHQVFVTDPDGSVIEVNFDAAEAQE
jgi:catechol 2,3-dioxygenase-like lactoylglutathione lyase family enzyme